MARSLSFMSINHLFAELVGRGKYGGLGIKSGTARKPRVISMQRPSNATTVERKKRNQTQTSRKINALENLSNNYAYRSEDPSWSNQYLWPRLRQLVLKNLDDGASIIDVGCGNGAISKMLADLNYRVVGVDPSESGISVATSHPTRVNFYTRSTYDSLAQEFGKFDAVVSLEVVEHCFSPQNFAQSVYELLSPGGVAIISTPFHGYWKNLALAVTGKFDRHWNPLWEGGHIKFWSEATLRVLLRETGFVQIEFERVGRIPPFAKSMIAIARKP